MLKIINLKMHDDIDFFNCLLIFMFSINLFIISCINVFELHNI